MSGSTMSHLNIYLSKEREKWLREHLQALARKDNRSLSYIVEEALVKFVKDQGKRVPQDPRKDHRLKTAGLLAVFFFPTFCAHAQLFPSLRAENFRRISFVGRCEQNQWSTNKEDKVELMMSAEPGESCEARL